MAKAHPLETKVPTLHLHEGDIVLSQCTFIFLLFSLLSFISIFLAGLLEPTSSPSSRFHAAFFYDSGQAPPRHPNSPTTGASWHFIKDTVQLDTAGIAQIEAHIPPWVFATEAIKSTGVVTSFSESTFYEAASGGASTAQDQEDEYAELNFFYQNRGGVILESGALDGVSFSISRFFSFARGWRCIHVEANPHSYRSLVGNRPDALNIHSALCNTSRTLHFAENPAVPSTSGIWEFLSPWVINSFFLDMGSPRPEVNTNTDLMPLIPCRPLGPLLAMFGITHIDLWVLDVEGAEEEVLASVDLSGSSSLTVDVITIELDGTHLDKDERCVAILKQAGYTLYKRVQRNHWYVRPGFVPSRAPGNAVAAGPGEKPNVV